MACADPWQCLSLSMVYPWCIPGVSPFLSLSSVDAFPRGAAPVCPNKPEFMPAECQLEQGWLGQGSPGSQLLARCSCQLWNWATLFLAYSQPDLSVQHFEVTTSARLMFVHFERCHFKNFCKFQNCPVGDLFHAKMSFQILNYILPHTFTL